MLAIGDKSPNIQEAWDAINLSILDHSESYKVYSLNHGLASLI